MKLTRLLWSAPFFLLCVNEALAETPKQVEIVNSPLAVTVENQLEDVTVSGTVDVSGSSVNATITNTPDVTVSNTTANPLPVSVVSNPNPNLPGTPMFAFKNAEGGGHPVLFGPLAADAKVAIGSITFDGGDDTYGTQVWLNITDCQGAVLDLGPAYMVRNNAAGLGPQHMVFPIPMVIPFEDPGQEWCFEASPTTDDQTLITVVGYLVE